LREKYEAVSGRDSKETIAGALPRNIIVKYYKYSLEKTRKRQANYHQHDDTTKK